MMLDLILLVLMMLAALWAVMAKTLLKSAIGLAIVSIFITIFMFRFDAALAGVFELSVCTGLITVVFLSAIGLTKPLSHKQLQEEAKNLAKRYGPLPILIGSAGLLTLVLMNIPFDFPLVQVAEAVDVRSILWNFRQLDLFGQVIILLAGSFGAVILFKEIKIDEWK